MRRTAQTRNHFVLRPHNYTTSSTTRPGLIAYRLSKVGLIASSFLALTKRRGPRLLPLREARIFSTLPGTVPSDPDSILPKQRRDAKGRERGDALLNRTPDSAHHRTTTYAMHLDTPQILSVSDEGSCWDWASDTGIIGVMVCLDLRREQSQMPNQRR
ncbi:hypothetical protein VTI28DRAFT_807 [Corynascus sepedonium]